MREQLIYHPKLELHHNKNVNNNHNDANKGKIKRYLNLEDVLGFCKSFKKGPKNLGFHLILKTNDLQDTIYTSMADDINVTINNLYLFVPNLIPSVATQLMFNETTQTIYKISFDEYYTERRVILDMIVQADIGSTQQVSSPKYLIFAHQTQDRVNVLYKKKKISISDSADLRKYHVAIDGQRYHRDSLLTNYEENVYMEQ